jgi:hypothetical protein
VVARFTAEETLATGQKISLRGLTYYRLADGKIVEDDWCSMPDLMQELEKLTPSPVTSRSPVAADARPIEELAFSRPIIRTSTRKGHLPVPLALGAAPPPAHLSAASVPRQRVNRRVHPSKMCSGGGPGNG